MRTFILAINVSNYFKILIRSFLASYTSSNSSSLLLAKAAARATKYGGNSPIAVPIPNNTVSKYTYLKISQIVTPKAFSGHSVYSVLYLFGTKLGTELHS